MTRVDGVLVKSRPTLPNKPELTPSIVHFNLLRALHDAKACTSALKAHKNTFLHLSGANDAIMNLRVQVEVCRTINTSLKRKLDDMTEECTQLKRRCCNK